MFTKRSKPESQTEPYWIKYSDYFEYDSLLKVYRYRIKLQSFGKNQQWPLDSCLNCSADLVKNPPSKTIHKIGKNENSLRIAFSFTAVIVIAIFLALAYSAYSAVIIALIFLAVVLMLTYLNHILSTKPVELIYCKKCGVLLYNKCPDVYTSTDTPKTVFSGLEKIREFKMG